MVDNLFNTGMVAIKKIIKSPQKLFNCVFIFLKTKNKNKPNVRWYPIFKNKLDIPKKDENINDGRRVKGGCGELLPPPI